MEKAIAGDRQSDKAAAAQAQQDAAAALDAAKHELQNQIAQAARDEATPQHDQLAEQASLASAKQLAANCGQFEHVGEGDQLAVGVPPAGVATRA